MRGFGQTSMQPRRPVPGIQLPGSGGGWAPAPSPAGPTSPAPPVDPGNLPGTPGTGWPPYDPNLDPEGPDIATPPIPPPIPPLPEPPYTPGYPGPSPITPRGGELPPAPQGAPEFGRVLRENVVPVLLVGTTLLLVGAGVGYYVGKYMR